jgi:hypothetical protein
MRLPLMRTSLMHLSSPRMVTSIFSLTVFFAFFAIVASFL